jgi:N-acetylglucosamine-6-sulfatase
MPSDLSGAGGKPFLVYLAHKAVHPNIIQRDDGSVVPLPGQPGLRCGRTPSRALRRQNDAATAECVHAAGRKPALLRRIDDLPPLGRTPPRKTRRFAPHRNAAGRRRESWPSLAALEKSGSLDNTVIVFTSDHGYFYGEHGLSEERRLAYEEAIRIPMLVRYPSRVKAGSTPSELVLSVDVAPTLLELAGLTSSASIQGRSLIPIFDGRAPDWRTSFLVEYFTDTVFPRIRNMGYTAVRTSRYKHIQYRELQNMNELYDLESDPYEERNLMDDPAARAVLQRVQSELERLLTETRFPSAARPVR